jgi:hypothetical protein
MDQALDAFGRRSLHVASLEVDGYRTAHELIFVAAGDVLSVQRAASSAFEVAAANG